MATAHTLALRAIRPTTLKLHVPVKPRQKPRRYITPDGKAYEDTGRGTRYMGKAKDWPQ